MSRPLAVWVQSLGCPKNRVDTERLLGSLGVPVKPCSRLASCRIALINTCAFIEPATRESIRAILDLAEKVKSWRRKPLVAVAGCLVGRYGMEELARELPEVDLWLDTARQERWPDLLRERLGLADPGSPGRLFSTPPSYAWLKISEGCKRNCAFCSIPAIKGPLRSEGASAILAEARDAIATGVKELILVAQDVGAWGADRLRPEKGPANLEQLLELLATLPGLRWLRLLYLYPESITDRLLQLFATQELPLLPYFDIPLQHCDPDILSRMRRPSTSHAEVLLERIRAALPDAALRTTLIVGFPGETEAQFKRLLQFVKDARFMHLGVFAYHAEEGTRAATMPDQVPEAVKEERRAEIMETQAKISAECLAQYVGSRMDVLVDEARHEEWPGLHVGRVWFQAPEIDGLTYVSGPNVEPGVMLPCDIEESSIYDLTALA